MTKVTKEKQHEYYVRWRAKLKISDPQKLKRIAREQARGARRRLKLKLITLMGGKCWRCGWHEHPMGLEFDHTDPPTKQYTPGDLISRYGSEKAIAYVTRRCIMLCANCHALKTVAYGENLRGNNISDTTAERVLYESIPTIDPRS